MARLFCSARQVLATNHVFDILVQAMGAGGNLEKIEEKTLPPRKRAGWTGGDDRGPSSKSAAKQEADQQISEESLDPSAVDKSDQGPPKDKGGEGGGTAASSSREDRAPSSDLTSTNAEKAGQQSNDSEETDPDTKNSDDRDRDAEGGSVEVVGVKVEGEEGVTQADIGVAGGTGETVVVKRAVEEGGDVGASPRVDGACKRGRTDTDGAGVA